MAAWLALERRQTPFPVHPSRRFAALDRRKLAPIRRRARDISYIIEPQLLGGWEAV